MESLYMALITLKELFCLHIGAVRNVLVATPANLKWFSLKLFGVLECAQENMIHILSWLGRVCRRELGLLMLLLVKGEPPKPSYGMPPCFLQTLRSEGPARMAVSGIPHLIPRTLR